MIGKITIGKSFSGCIAYCLEDKKLEHSQEIAFKNRAEVLCGNFCYGSKEELVSQFDAVRALNPKVEKPVMHLTFSLAPGESLERGKLIALVQEVAKEMSFEQNQYLAVSHLDTGHQHVHVVVNRVGYDGRTLKDNNNYGKVAACCRKMELKYGLKQVLSPRRYLSKEQRQLPRQDIRKEALREHIRQTLSISKNYEGFEQRMKGCGYVVLKGRGISFLDEKGVKIKGSEVGYSIRRIEQLLEQKQPLKQELQSKQETGKTASLRIVPGANERQLNRSVVEKQAQGTGLDKVVHLLLKPEQDSPGMSPNVQEIEKKKKRKKKSLHL